MKEDKKQALAQFHRDTIQAAAEKLFLEFGVEHVSVDEIAKSAGYSKATLYVYFESKAAIWTRILHSAMHLLKQRIENALNTEEGYLAQYFAICKAITVFSEEYPLYFESLLGAIPLEGDELSQKTFEIGEEIVALVGQLIAQGIEEGVVRPEVQVPRVAIIFWSCIAGMIRMTAQKEAYILQSTGQGKGELLSYGFETLLQSIKRD